MASVQSLDSRGLICPVEVYSAVVGNDGRILGMNHSGRSGYLTEASFDEPARLVHLGPWLMVRGVRLHYGQMAVLREDTPLVLAACQDSTCGD